MIRFKKYMMFLVSALMIATLSGCLGADLEECPPGLNYSVVFEYLIHPKEPADLFTSDVKNITVYVFDASSKICVYTDTSPIEAWTKGSNNEYKMTLPLNAGDYDIIAWGWGYENEEYLDTAAFSVAPKTAISRNVPYVAAAMTSQKHLTDDDVVLRVDPATGEDAVTGKIEPTFFGQKMSVNIPPMTATSPSVKDTIPLKNIANRIRVVIENAQENGIRIADWKNNLRVSIVGSNQEYYFNPQDRDRSRRPVGWVPPSTEELKYAPYFAATDDMLTYKQYNKHYTDEILVEDQIVNYGSDGIDSVFIADVSTMRMIAGDEDLAIRVEWDGPGIVDDIKLLNISNGGSVEDHGLIVREFVKYYTAAFHEAPTKEQLQYELDKHFEWIIFLTLPNNLGDTHMTATLQVLDWNLVNQDDSGGNSDIHVHY